METTKLIRRIIEKTNQKNGTRYMFINWLERLNPGMLHNGNLYCFEHAIKNLPTDHPVVEIGSFCGLSTNVIAFLLNKYSRPNKFITSDKWIFEGGVDPNTILPGSKITYRQLSKFARESYIRNISFFSADNLPYTVEQFSDDFFELWNQNEKVKDVLGRDIKLGGPISFAYIDGNHSYEFARRDFINVDQHLDRNGFILFDDSADSSEWEVKRVIKEVKSSGRYELVMKNPNYLFKKLY